MPRAPSKCDLAKWWELTLNLGTFPWISSTHSQNGYQLEHIWLALRQQTIGFRDGKREDCEHPPPPKWHREDGVEAVMKPDLGSLSTMFIDCSTCYPCRTNMLPLYYRLCTRGPEHPDVKTGCNPTHETKHGTCDNSQWKVSGSLEL